MARSLGWNIPYRNRYRFFVPQRSVVGEKSKFQIESYFATENFSYLFFLFFFYLFSYRDRIRIPLNFSPLFHHGNYPVNPSLSFNSISHFFLNEKRKRNTDVYTDTRYLETESRRNERNFII